MIELSAMILTGGASSRFGSDKSQAVMGGKALLENLLMSLPLAIDIVIVGPRLTNTSRSVRYTQEDPPGGGPVAAIEAGLNLVVSEFVVIIATDMPFANQILTALTEFFPDTEDATIPIDSEGVRQPLCALYRRGALVGALKQLGRAQGQSMRNLVQLLAVKELRLDPVLEPFLLDVDTHSDLERAISLSKEPEQ